jgi:hypothetical protein
MPNYKIKCIRTEYRSIEVDVSADHDEQALNKASELASDTDFRQYGTFDDYEYDYEIISSDGIGSEVEALFNLLKEGWGVLVDDKFTHIDYYNASDRTGDTSQDMVSLLNDTLAIEPTDIDRVSFVGWTAMIFFRDKNKRSITLQFVCPMVLDKEMARLTMKKVQ